MIDGGAACKFVELFLFSLFYYYFFLSKKKNNFFDKGWKDRRGLCEP